MLSLSNILIRHHQMTDFAELVEIVKAYARKGEFFLEFDVRPPFDNTPEDWQDQLEAAFTSAKNITP